MTSNLFIQHSLLDTQNYIIEKNKSEVKKRIHYVEPKWEKFYSVYACDFTKYNALCTAITDQNFDKVIQNYPDVDLITLKSYTRKDFDKLKLLCYAKDEEGKKIHLGDQKHIFRFKTLNNLKSLLVKYLENRPVFHSDSVKISFDNFTYYQEAYEARDPKDRIIEEIELDWLENYNIKQKINTYIKVLRLCRKGILLQQAVNYVKECPV